jgi:hypothetical protein
VRPVAWEGLPPWLDDMDREDRAGTPEALDVCRGGPTVERPGDAANRRSDARHVGHWNSVGVRALTA